MVSQQPSQKIIMFFLLSIILFDDFRVSDECINLLIKDHIEKETLAFFLSTLNELTQSDFYMVRFRDVKKSLDLYCQSDPAFFDELNKFVEVQFREITTDRGIDK